MVNYRSGQSWTGVKDMKLFHAPPIKTAKHNIAKKTEDNMMGYAKRNPNASERLERSQNPRKVASDMVRRPEGYNQENFVTTTMPDVRDLPDNILPTKRL